MQVKCIKEACLSKNPSFPLLCRKKKISRPNLCICFGVFSLAKRMDISVACSVLQKLSQLSPSKE